VIGFLIVFLLLKLSLIKLLEFLVKYLFTIFELKLFNFEIILAHSNQSLSHLFFKIHFIVATEACYSQRNQLEIT
jgi:hypothetical protein